MNKFQWNLNRNSYLFIQENAFKDVVCEKAAILSRPQCVKREPNLDFSVPKNGMLQFPAIKWHNIGDEAMHVYFQFFLGFVDTVPSV